MFRSLEAFQAKSLHACLCPPADLRTAEKSKVWFSLLTCVRVVYSVSGPNAALPPGTYCTAYHLFLWEYHLVVSADNTSVPFKVPCLAQEQQRDWCLPHCLVLEGFPHLLFSVVVYIYEYVFWLPYIVLALRIIVLGNSMLTLSNLSLLCSFRMFQDSHCFWEIRKSTNI